MVNEVIFDLETQKLFSDTKTGSPEELGVSIVSVYKRELDDFYKEIAGEMISFWEDELENLWELFQNADRIIGFNTYNFDIPVLSVYAPFPLRKLNHFDIMDEFKKIAGRRVSLNTLARDNLGVKKMDVGTNAVKYWRQNDKESLSKLKRYCEDDVDITKRIYDHVFKTGELKFKDRWNTLRKIEIDFSYPEQKDEEQIGLF